MDQAATQKLMPEISATELKERLDRGEDIQIVDVREDSEVAIAKIPNSIHIPLAQVLDRMSEIDPSRETVVHCKMGGRSARAIDALKRSGYQGNLANLRGGIIAWSNEVDPSVPKY
jgi:rhodanese-related sulfurtransferase